MDHSEATRIKASEQYLLGELTGDLREQFEEHYFDCQECALDLRAGAAFVDNAKDVLRAEKDLAKAPRADGRRWFDLFLRPAYAVPAMALLALVVAYQSTIVIPRLKTNLADATAPQTIPSFSLIAENSRGGSSLAIVVPQGKPFSIFLDIPPEKQFSSYNCELQTDSGTPEFEISVPAQEARNTVQLLIPASRLRPGKHVLVVRGGVATQVSGAAATEIARYTFTLEFTK
ncbi:MAG: zf-HC2 domain-containing protein [Candidatus Acidiferrales bacterium]